MKKFLAIYTGSATSANRVQWDRLDEQRRKRRQAAGMQVWRDWMATHQSMIVDAGGPLGKTKRATAQGISDARNNLAAYVIIRAGSHEAAARLFENHPHFMIFPGDAAEIMAYLPSP